MDQFQRLYFDYCKSYQIEPNEIILGEIQKLSNNQTTSFNLSSLTLPEEQYTILGKLFAKDFLYTSIHLNDCNISSESLQALLHGLISNTTCKTLELKGNSIHGAGTEALSKVLRRNQTLQNLRLEWNQLGSMDSPAFTGFCEALGKNKSLIELDLRNNDISHVGGTELAAALKRNVTLRILDLRWNNIGLIGGRALLAVCQTNSTLNELKLTGNDIPDDIIENLNNTLAKNGEKRQIHFGHTQNMSLLARQLQNVHTEKDRQIASVLSRVSIQEQALLKANKSLAEKLKKLTDEINDRKLAFNALSAKNALLEADITVSNQKYQDSMNEIKRLQIENEHLIHQLRKEHQHEKDELFHLNNKLQHELNENIEQNRRLTDRSHDLERKNEIFQTNIHEFRESMIKIDRDHQLKLSSFDDENQRLKLKYKEEFKDQELLHAREFQRLKESYQITEENLKEQLNKLETIRTNLERENNSLKSNLSNQKILHDEIFQQEKLRILNDEERKQHELNDRLRSIVTSKEELESRYNQQLISIRDFQQKIQFQSVEIETLKRQIESLQTTNLSKETEIVEIREKSRTEYEKRLRGIQKDIEMNEELKDRIKQLETDLKDQRFNDRNTIRDLETRLADLQSKFNQREQEILRLKHDEEKRLHFLRTAMLDYIGRGTKTN